MTNITIKSLEPQLAQRLQQRAIDNGRTIEAEVASILASALIPEKAEESALDLATAIKQRFEPLGDFDIPEIPRELIRTPPLF
ncbi:MAG: plasmid stability protein [Phormidesmis priestleyi]|uniref:Plasmid stability protein n=1 Tax=Phormidesmis priestleyi TaxID=268141 RepID=A0A2W4ZEB5_9CYAN|nr:MAG: plasmid stability protein [Phormidesmis priestleyi]